MEEHSRQLSLYICQQILQNTILTLVIQEAEHLSSVLNVFSYKKSENLSTTMISTSNYFHGNPQNRFTEDIPTEALEKKPFKVRETRKLQKKSKNSFSGFRKGQQKMLGNLTPGFLPGQELRLIPLKVSDEQSGNEGEEDQFQEKMRQVKVHQQYVRSRYAQNMRQSNKKMLTHHKMDAKIVPKVPIYDYDGSLVAPLKPDAGRYPVHYLDLEVIVQEDQHRQQRLTQSKVKKPVAKPKNMVKFDQSVKKDQLKPVFSSFLKDLSNVEWVEGVELQSNKQQCRKILGYSYNQLSQKKKLDLFKNHENPIKLRLQQLQNYKLIVKRGTQCLISRKSMSKKFQSTKTILTREDTRNDFEGSKTILVANNKALEYLIKQDEQLGSKKKLSIFANAKSYQSRVQQSPNYLKLNSNIVPSAKEQFHLLKSNVGKKGKVVIQSRVGSQNKFDLE